MPPRPSSARAQRMFGKKTENAHLGKVWEAATFTSCEGQSELAASTLRTHPLSGKQVTGHLLYASTHSESILDLGVLGIRFPDFGLTSVLSLISSRNNGLMGTTEGRYII